MFHPRILSQWFTTHIQCLTSYAFIYAFMKLSRQFPAYSQADEMLYNTLAMKLLVLLTFPCTILLFAFVSPATFQRISMFLK